MGALTAENVSLASTFIDLIKLFKFLGITKYPNLQPPAPHHLLNPLLMITWSGQNLDKETCIINHINRSGTNFLIGNTPFKNLPTFPDITSIYNKIKGYDQVVVHTVGSRRFKTFSEKNTLVSEIVGLVAPVWYYVGTKIFAKSY